MHVEGYSAVAEPAAMRLPVGDVRPWGMTTEELAWLAGLLEGEGCFDLRCASRRKHLFYPRIRVYMNDRDIIERVAALIHRGVGSSHTPSMKASGANRRYGTAVEGRHAVALMRALYPMLGERRRAKIDELLEGDDRYSD